MSEPYRIWACEVLKLIDDKHQHTEETVVKLTEKLREDVRDWLVPEEFCSDCDYQRRCNS